jgi:hypothetical protein
VDALQEFDASEIRQAGLIEVKDYVMTPRFTNGDTARLPIAALAKTGKPARGPYSTWSRGGLSMSYS